ncbi:MAG: response regulator transcription factor [Metamycoplasmataceae bacterium]
MTNRNTHLKIVLASNQNEDNKFIKVFSYCNELFWINFEHYIPEEVLLLEKSKIDFLFIRYEKNLESVFNWEFYSILHKKNRRFKLVWLVDNISDQDKINLLKWGADDFLDFSMNEELLKWKIISLLRRRWDEFNKEETVIYKSFVIDKNNEIVYVNDKKINLTKKEFELLWYLYNASIKNREQYINKNEIFRNMWNDDKKDHTRVLDQLFLRLKKKIGEQYFDIKKLKGIKIK